MLKKIAVSLLSLSTLISSPEEEVAKDMNSFAISLYAEDKASENSLFSPYSIFSCLSMAAYGASGETATQMGTVLKLSLPFNVLPEGLSSLSQKILTPDFMSANSAWVDQSMTILPAYQNTLETAFNAQIQGVNFQDPKKTTEEINQWVSTKTQGKIPTLFEENMIDSSTRFVLTNAVYFKGAWKKPFSAEQTHPAPFFTIPQVSTEVPMMHQRGFFPYLETEQHQLVALPFSGNDQLACLILLPKPGATLEDVESSLSAESLTLWMNGLLPKNLDLSIPKFSLKNRINLNTTLKTLGMPLAFSPMADFSGINGLKNLYIDTVIHEALFDLDENGVTAAAATGVSMNMTTSLSPPPTTFTADHPFLFFIVELRTQTVLFMGKLKRC